MNEYALLGYNTPYNPISSCNVTNEVNYLQYIRSSDDLIVT